MHLFILEQRPQKQIHFNHTLFCLFASHIWTVKWNLLCILNLYGLWCQWCLCAFLRPNLSRWMRRTRPTPWCLWLLYPRSHSTSRPSMVSLHQKMGPTLPPPPTDTLPPRPQWLTRRCESWHPDLLVLSITHWDTLPTTPSAASETVHTLRQIQHESTKYIHLPSSSTAPLGTMTTTTTMKFMTMKTIMSMPVMWKIWDQEEPTYAVFGNETAQQGTDLWAALTSV